VVKNSKSKKNWTRCRLLIIDEISMLDAGLFEKLDYIARALRCSPDRPYGGIQLLLSGDFFQLPPVAPKGKPNKFCFQSPLWQEMFGPENMIELKKIFRQEEAEFVQLLSEVRFNKLSANTLVKLGELQRPLDCPNGIISTKLYSTNIDVDTVNQRFLKELPGEEVVLSAKDHPPESNLDKVFMAQKNLVLKVNAQVMLIKNLDSKLVNGSRGIVESFGPEVDDYGKEVPGSRLMPVVRFLSGETRRIAVADWKVLTGTGAVQATRIQVPLKLAWAVTIHKSQGLTIDHLEVDLGGVFEFGQAYVALSRARRLQGLRVLSFNRMKIRSSPDVIAFYEQLNASAATATTTAKAAVTSTSSSSLTSPSASKNENQPNSKKRVLPSSILQASTSAPTSSWKPSSITAPAPAPPRSKPTPYYAPSASSSAARDSKAIHSALGADLPSSFLSSFSKKPLAPPPIWKPVTTPLRPPAPPAVQFKGLPVPKPKAAKLPLNFGAVEGGGFVTASNLLFGADYAKTVVSPSSPPKDE